MTALYERRYTSPTAQSVHLLPPFEFATPDRTPTALCGKWMWTASDWFGSGSQSEYDRAAALPVCKTCAKRLA